MSHVRLLVREDFSLRPLGAHALAEVRKLPIAKHVFALFEQPRNAAHSRKFFAIVDAAFEQQERFDNRDRFRAYMAVKAGYANTYEFPTATISPSFASWLFQRNPQSFFEANEDGSGVRIMEAKSLKFAKMGQPEFANFYERALDVLAREFGMDVQALERENRNG
jgi:hypothetical protein